VSLKNSAYLVDRQVLIHYIIFYVSLQYNLLFLSIFGFVFLINNYKKQANASAIELKNGILGKYVMLRSIKKLSTRILKPGIK
jgi:hypothetical protein